MDIGLIDKLRQFPKTGGHRSFPLGINDQGLQDVSDFIDVGHSTIATNTLQFRPDLWVLPFLNVYGLFGVGTNVVDVTVGKPDPERCREKTSCRSAEQGNVSLSPH